MTATGATPAVARLHACRRLYAPGADPVPQLPPSGARPGAAAGGAGRRQRRRQDQPAGGAVAAGSRQRPQPRQAVGDRFPRARQPRQHGLGRAREAADGRRRVRPRHRARSHGPGADRARPAPGAHQRRAGALAGRFRRHPLGAMAGAGDGRAVRRCRLGPPPLSRPAGDRDRSQPCRAGRGLRHGDARTVPPAARRSRRDAGRPRCLARRAGGGDGRQRGRDRGLAAARRWMR